MQHMSMLLVACGATAPVAHLFDKVDAIRIGIRLALAVGTALHHDGTYLRGWDCRRARHGRRVLE